MWKDARKRNVVKDEPIRLLEWPSPSSIDLPDPFTEDEIGQLIGYFHERMPFYEPFVINQFWTGMRPSEVVALRWSDIDLTRGIAHVHRIRTIGTENKPKTAKSNRDVSLLLNVAEALGSIKPLRALDDEHVFLTHQRGKVLNQYKFSHDNWSRVLRGTNIRPRKRGMYATRHTYISVALSHGVNHKWISEQCGTSLAMIEKSYGKYIGGDAAPDAVLQTLVAKKKADQYVQIR